MKEDIADIIEKTIKAQMAPMMAKVDSIERVQSMIKDDMDNDRKDFAEMKTSQVTVERLAREVLDMYDNIKRAMAKKVSEAIEKAIDEGAEAVANLVEPAMEKGIKKFKIGQPLRKKKYWFQFWKK